MSKPTIVPRSLRNPSLAPITRFGWDNNLSALPALTFDPDLSTGIDEAQLLAGLSVDSGALVVNQVDMRSAGAGVGAVGVAWLTDKILSGPAQLYVDCNNTTSTGFPADNGMVGLGLYYYASADAAAPSNPPGGSAPLTTAELGRQGSGTRSYSRRAFGPVSASSANSDFVGQTLDWLPYSNGRSGIVRQGSSYPPNVSTSVFTEQRAVSAAPMAAGHRGRLALIVTLTGTGNLPTIDIRRVQLDYIPAS